MYVAWRGIALAIDYSLFMLTRYMEEVQSGASTEMSLKSMMRQSGHVVMISASVLIICYVSRMKDSRQKQHGPGMSYLWNTYPWGLPLYNCILYNNCGQPTVIPRWKNLKAENIGRTERIHKFWGGCSILSQWRHRHHWPGSITDRLPVCSDELDADAQPDLYISRQSVGIS